MGLWFDGGMLAGVCRTKTRLGASTLTQPSPRGRGLFGLAVFDWGLGPAPSPNPVPEGEGFLVGFAVFAGFVGFEVGQGDLEEGGGLWGGSGDEVGDDVVGFDAVSGFDVSHHGGGEDEAGFGDHGAHSGGEGFAWGVVVGFGDLGGFVEDGCGEGGSAGFDDVGDGGAHEAGQGGEGGEEDPFFPHVLEDGGAGFAAAFGDGFAEGLDTGGEGAVLFAEGEGGEFAEVADGAVGVEGCGDLALAAEDGLGAEAGGEGFEVFHAVEEGEDCGLWGYGGG